MINLQPIEKRVVDGDGVLDVHSIFYSIQGEGPYTGHVSVFVRLAGCNLQCPGCDTDYTSKRAKYTPIDLFAAVRQMHYGDSRPRPLVVITGGEPFRQNISPFAVLMLGKGYRVQVETNGTLPVSPNLPDEVVIVCSPKAGKVNSKIEKRVDYYKYVLSADSVDPTDGLPLTVLNNDVKRVARPPKTYQGPIYLQPMDPGSDQPIAYGRNVEAVLDSCMKFGYVLQLQVHKILGVE
ncbi:MAG TPA: 7-carboxy-7-deazaguanine synthase QueE [Burkholderiaceae bacterium]|jgi:organic radical activating enzyme|nr:7-carboxy-7-deazaguanine synthase QueE [Burkholderiaceae bacterium]